MLARCVRLRGVVVAMFLIFGARAAAAMVSHGNIAQSAAETRIRLQPTDTSLNINNTNYSADPTLTTYTWPDYKVANAIVMKFDLSSLPAGAVVQEATLHLSLLTSDVSLDPTYTVSAHKIVGRDPVIERATGYTTDGATSWTPNSCCSNNVPLAQADISAAYDEQPIDKLPGDKSWAITSMVQEWLKNPSTNFGLLLNSDATKPRDRYRYFASVDNPLIAVRPFLEVVYTVSAQPDTTPPLVSISAPAAGSTVSEAIAVAAQATDQVGVAGVTFQIDGVSLGPEDTTAPYSADWNTASTSDGPHVIMAVARDTSDNTSTSEPVTVTVSNAAGRSIVFESNWDTATGLSAPAVTDGGKWPNYWEFNGGSNVQLLSVVQDPNGFQGHNALRVQQRGASYAANIQLDDFLPPSQDFYLRFYMMNEDTSVSGDHVVTVDTWKYSNLTYVRKSSGSADWRYNISLYGCGDHYPLNHWAPPARLVRGSWYRFEYFVHFVDPTHIQVHPRVYDANGSLLYSDADFRQQDYQSGGTWNGRDDWTLASYYQSGYSFCVDPAFVNDFGMGNNGQYGATNTGAAWYFAAVQIRTDTWPGPASLPPASVVGRE